MDHWRNRRLERRNKMRLIFGPILKELKRKKEKLRTRSIFDAQKSFTQALKKRGFEYLGCGYYSTVLGKPGSDKVLKISSDDGGWMRYILWASKEGYNGTFAPKVYSYKWIKQGSFGISVMERLKPARNDNFHLMASVFKHTVRADKPEVGQKMLEIGFPGLGDFASKFKTALMGQKQFSLDLHAANYMARNDNELVFTDPVSGTHKPVKRRYRTKDLIAA